ncbi:hypothetical protein CAL7716_082390 [Calothrix sp. PCC 7716]|nr:hypothetical protein CAL7716_082390 [Calothrix sp. PCC 7716]
MMTYKPSIISVHQNLEASSIVPVALAYNFDYSQFALPDLQTKAKSTLGSFLGFVRQTFDGLLEVGRALQDLYFDCLRECPDGKKVFEEWVKSDDFGSSRYIATSAMEIWTWFEKLSPKIQRLVRQNVQKWSVSALRQLTKVSTDLVKELVRTGKKTAQQVKKSGGGEVRESGGVIAKQSLQNDKSQLDSPTPLSPGVRVIVTHDKIWAGHRGIIMSQQSDSFWVLLDNTVAQGMEVKNLFKENQLQPETKQVNNSSASKNLFTLEQVEEKIAQALAQQDREKAEEEQGRFIEIRDAALQAAKRELVAAEQHAQKLVQAKQALIEQLAAKEEELQSVRTLQIENQKLEQRVAELEKALEGANANSWGNTFNAQAAKVVNSDLEKTIAPLMAQVERLQNVVELKDKELIQLRTISVKQQQELKALEQNTASAPDYEEVITTFGEVGQSLGWNGWGRRGYRSEDGTLHTGINALAAFISDLTHSDNLCPEVAF